MFKKAPVGSRVLFVAEQIEEAIVEGRFNPGDKLPTLQEMQGMFGTGLSTIREALTALAQKGLLETKQGAGGGTFVKAVSAQTVTDSLGLLIRTRNLPLEEIFQFRSCFDAPVAGQAAEMAQEEEITDLKAMMKEAEALAKEGVSRWEEFYLVEARMHSALARMTHNLLIETITDVLANNNRYYRTYLPREEKNIHETCEDWRGLIEALENRKKGRAMMVAKTHLQRYVKYFEEFSGSGSFREKIEDSGDVGPEIGNPPAAPDTGAGRDQPGNRKG